MARHTRRPQKVWLQKGEGEGAQKVVLMERCPFILLERWIESGLTLALGEGWAAYFSDPDE